MVSRMMLLISVLLASGVEAAKNKCSIRCEKKFCSRCDRCRAKYCSPPPSPSPSPPSPSPPPPTPSPPSPSPPPPSPSPPPPSPSPPSPSPPPPSPSPPPPSPSPPPSPTQPPPSPSPPPPSPSPPACTGHTFTDKASLQTAAREYNSNPASATAKYGAIAGWCVSGVTDMNFLFYNLGNFNADISGWDTSRVTTMWRMFDAFNQPLSWDTSSVTQMNYMFYYANSLSAANKLLIRCAWAGTPAFASAGFGSDWAPGSCP